MAKKISNQQAGKGNLPLNKPNVVIKQQKKIATENKSFLSKYSSLLVMFGIAIIVFLVLKTCLENQITNWDDPGYIKDNALIKDVSGAGIKNIFSTAIMGNYHPLTILSYAIEYSYVHLEPYLFHLDSLLIHIICTILFFWFMQLLTSKTVASAIAALLFGLHPMHIESVAWIAARKDVLYGSFYAASCIFYVYYVRANESKKWTYYVLSVFFFACSILSKPVAVSLPVTLFLIDYFEKRNIFTVNTPSGKKINWKICAEKLVYFLISIGLGIRSIYDQQDFKALNTLDVHFNIFERISLGAYAFVTYLWKSIVPIGLSNFYPYPEKVKDSLPATYYLYIIILVALVFLIWRFARKSKILLFGSLFFIINIALLLQFIPVGGAILADRYTYIPYFGLFFIEGIVIADFWEANKDKLFGSLAIAGIFIYLCILGFLGNQRCKVWYDTISLWRDEVEKHPNVPSAFNNLGFEYFNRGNLMPDPKTRNIYLDSSNLLLKEAIRLQPNFVNPYISLGEVARTRENFPEAKMYYYKALSLSKNDETFNAYLGLAIIYSITGQQMEVHALNAKPFYDSAQYCFRSAIRQKPYFPEAHSNYGNFFDMMHNFDSSLKEYTLAISQNPDMYAPYLNRARLFQRHNKCDEGFKDFTKALELSPDIGEIYYARSFCYMQKGDKKLALNDVQKAISLGFTQIDPNYYNAVKQ